MCIKLYTLFSFEKRNLEEKERKCKVVSEVYKNRREIKLGSI
jgi:hypothetical protein